MRASQFVYNSIFGSNFYYVSRQLAVTAGNSPQARLNFEGNFRYYQTDYPEGRPPRQDEVLGARFSVSYRFNSIIVGRLFVDAQSRQSILAQLDYETTVIGIAVGLGR